MKGDLFKMFNRILTLALFLILLPIHGTSQTQQITLAFDTLPSQQGWAFGTNASASSVTETSIFSLCNGFLCLNTLSLPFNDGNAVWYSRTDVNNTQPFTISVRARLLNGVETTPASRYGFYFGASTGSGDVAIGIGIDSKIQVYDPPSNPTFTVPNFDSNQWNDYRLEVTPGGLTASWTLFINGTPIRTGRPLVYPGVPTTSSLVFGDGSSFSSVSAEIARYEYFQGIFMTVSIDIKPGSFPNSINLGSNGTVPVAILSSLTFDATTVDPLTVKLAGAAVALRGKGTPNVAVQDTNFDGRPDLVVHVSTEALQLTEGDTEAVLTGQTYSGQLIRGIDSIRVVP